MRNSPSSPGRLPGRRIGLSLSLTALVPMVLPVALTVPTVPVMAQASEEKPSTTLQLSTSSGRLVTMAAPITDVFTANPAIADVQVRSPTQLYIIAKGAGETSIFAVAKGGRVVYSANVRVSDNLSSVNSLAGMFRAAMPNADITATTMNGLVLLTGSVGSPADLAEAERLAKAYVGDKMQVVSRLSTATPMQVNLQVKFAEVSRSFVKNIGLNTLGQGTNGLGQTPTAPGAFYNNYCNAGTCSQVPFGQLPTSPGQFMGTTGTITPSSDGISSTFGIAGRVLGLNMMTALQLGEQAGQVTTLASPNLTALSGETGSFLAGGEIPVPSPQPSGSGGVATVTVAYKQYGVSLSYTPTVLSDGRISLRVRPEVSQLSSAGAVQMNGLTIPAFTTRRAETTVELGSGQSFMIAGLLQNDQNNSITKIPGAGDIPILGTLFRSNAFQRNETELVIIITPYLVKPVNTNDLKLPTDTYRTPNDAERVLLGRVSGQTRSDRPKPTLVTPGMSALADPAATVPAGAGDPPTGTADPSAVPPSAPPPAAPDPQAAAIPIPRTDPSAPGFSSR